MQSDISENGRQGPLKFCLAVKPLERVASGVKWIFLRILETSPKFIATQEAVTKDKCLKLRPSDCPPG